jgi:hypothetical protein
MRLRFALTIAGALLASSAERPALGCMRPEVIQRIVRLHWKEVHTCYLEGKDRRPVLAGKVVVTFVIGAGGRVISAKDGGSDIGDRGVVDCVVGVFKSLRFPAPDGGSLTLTYPIRFGLDGA